MCMYRKKTVYREHSTTCSFRHPTEVWNISPVNKGDGRCWCNLLYIKNWQINSVNIRELDYHSVITWNTGNWWKINKIQLHVSAWTNTPNTILYTKASFSIIAFTKSFKIKTMLICGKKKCYKMAGASYLGKKNHSGVGGQGFRPGDNVLFSKLCGICL